jgi:hypothetical protein
MARRLIALSLCFALLTAFALLRSGTLPSVRGAASDGREIVLTVPVGGDGVHYSATGDEMLPWGPSALAVAPDGSYWIADAVANRLLHYAASGKRLPTIELSVHHVVGVADIAVGPESIAALDIAAVQPRVLRFSFDGQLLASYDLPKSLSLENGLSGIALGEHGELLIERDGGAFLSELSVTRGAVSMKSVNGYSWGGVLYSARAADPAAAQASSGAISIGATRIAVNVANTLGGLSILGVNSDDSFYAVVDEVAIVDSLLRVDQTVRLYSSSGDTLGVARIPLAGQHTAVAHALAMGPDGAAYALLTLPDRVEVQRLTFSLKLKAILPTLAAQSLTAQDSAPEALGCVARATMLATAQGYVNNSKYLNAANTDGTCENRIKPHYLAGAGVYPSVSYDLGGFDTVSGWNSLMDPNTFQAGDAPDPGNIESCSRGVDCSGFVSRVWQLPTKYWTGTIPNVSTELASVNDMRPGDVFNDADEHVMLFAGFASNGIRVYESTSSQNFDRVVYNFRPWSMLASYSPRRYNNVCADAAPATPSGLAALPATSTQINLSWTAVSGDKDGYKVYRADGTVVSTTASATLQVKGLSACTEYSFYVTAYKGGLESAPSAPASARTNRPAGTSEISGYVRDMLGNPLPGANVAASLGARYDETDTGGAYTLCGAPAGALTITAVRDGFASGAVTINAGTVSPVTAPDIVLAPACPLGQLRAEYYNNRVLGGDPTLVRCETALTYDWGNGGPGGSISNDNFSVRWIGYMPFEAASYTFIARADDGVRLWLDREKIIDGWSDHSVVEYRAARPLTAGVHLVTIEYYENGGIAVAQARWERAAGAGGCANGQFLAQYYGNRTLAGSPVLTRCDSTISNDWGNAGPGSGAPDDLFSARWTGRHSFAAGPYTFTAAADDGIRLWVDGALLIDAWRDQSPTTYQATRTMTAGEHEIRVEYYENLGSALASVRWEAAVAPGHLRIDSVRFTPLLVTGGTTIEVRVGVSNDGSGPLTLMGPDNVTYNEDATGGWTPSQAGKWRIGVDFGGRPATMLDHPYRFGKDLTLQAGQSTTIGGYIRLTTLRSTDVWVGAVQELVRWDQDNVGRTHIAVTPSACSAGKFLAQYYNGRTMSGAPVFSRCEAAISNDWGSGGPGNGVSADNFSVRWTGRVSFAARTYTFIARADDGMRIWLDGALLLDKWIDQAVTEYRVPRAMTAGEHDVLVDYYESGGLAVAGVRWE